MDKIKLRITVVTALAVFLLKGTDTFAQQTDPTLTGAVFAQTSTLKNIYDKRQKAHEKIIAAETAVTVALDRVHSVEDKMLEYLSNAQGAMQNLYQIKRAGELVATEIPQNCSLLLKSVGSNLKGTAIAAIVSDELADAATQMAALYPFMKQLVTSGSYDTGGSDGGKEKHKVNLLRKSATCVGDVLGRYHPHGDASVYDALVRLAQDFSMRYMLVDGHGNFGSVDGDPPAAYRYTEARLSKISDEMLRDIEKDTVDWDPNFDESRKEPRVLPARFPNLLVNGSSGIAVGMATNIPPHNLREVIGACICVLDDPNASLSDLMEHIKGPDFPTKGIIMGRSGIRAAYATGRGRIVVRARHEFEEFGHDRTRIVITELPYQVNKRMLIKSMADQVEDKRLEGISNIQDESDRNGMRIVIELKRDANPQVVLNRLFNQTQLQVSFAVNMLALVDNQHQPKILSLRHIIDEYLAFQEEIIIRRTRYDLKKAQERAHLLEGLLIAQDNIDEVIKIIRSAYDDAKQKLMERFGLDDIQAQAILDMRLKALQGLDREKLESEYKELEERIAYFNRVLSDESLVRQILKEELTAIAEKFGDDRKTEIQDVEDEIDIEDLIEEEQCVFTLTEAGYIKRTPVSEYTAQSKGGMGKKGITTREEDTVVDVFTASTHDHILFFTDTGKVYRKKGYQIPESGKTAKGTNLINILQIEQGERVQAMLHYRETGEEQLYLMMVTRNGTVKRLPVEALKNLRNNGIRALTMDEGDQLVSVRETDGSQKILIATHDGMAVVFDENDVRPMGRSAMGVRGIRLREGDYVVGAARAREGKSVLTITEKGYGKRTPVEEYRITNRGGLGIKNYQITEKIDCWPEQYCQ